MVARVGAEFGSIGRCWPVTARRRWVQSVSPAQSFAHEHSKSPRFWRHHRQRLRL